MIFQRHHIPPDDFFKKSEGAQAFMLQSMIIQLEAEKKAKEEREREAAFRKSSRM